MPRLAQTAGLTDVQQEILKTVKRFVDKEIIPHAQALEHADEYPADIVAGMREMGLFGLTIPEEYGGLGESLLTYALVVEQIARGWMSVSGIINTHFIVAHMIKQHGTPEQKQKFLPRMAVGEVRGSFSMSEPDLGSDVAAITTSAARDEAGGYKVNGAKMWLTNGGSSTLIALLARTDEGAAKPHQNLTAFLVQKPTGFGEVLPGLTIPGKIGKMGYKGVDTTEALFDNFELPADSVLGGRPGRGFAQMMDGIEVGRVNVSARACGMTIRAFELAVGYAQQRRTFGKPIADHQAIAFKLAEMATKVEAAHLMMVNAARLKDSGERNDVAAGMAKLLASEYCAEVTQDAFRIHGGYGYSTEYEIERLMREAPFLLIGEGTSEIQKMIISRGLLREYKILKPMSRTDPGDSLPERRLLTAQNAELDHGGLLEVLSDLAVLLSAANQSGYSRGISSIHDALRDAHGDRAREQAIVRRILSLNGGMGSFQDLVLQDPDGVRPEQDEFDRLRHRLFEGARAALR
jgi:alkylation response protein AidB-like acyl-CoA dehydrogenase